MTLPFETTQISPKRPNRRSFIGGSDARIIMGQRRKRPPPPLARKAGRRLFAPALLPKTYAKFFPALTNEFHTGCFKRTLQLCACFI
jgi:hypothetical protein